MGAAGAGSVRGVGTGGSLKLPDEARASARDLPVGPPAADGITDGPGAASTLATAEEAIEEIRLGRLVIVVDDEDRENEGDLICAAQAATAESVNFMARFGRGLICVPMEEERLAELDLQPMVQVNTAKLGTPFTVSVDADRGDDHRDLGPRPGDHHPGAHPAGDAAGGPGPAGPHLPSGGAQGRRPAACRAHRGGGRPGPSAPASTRRACCARS